MGNMFECVLAGGSEGSSGLSLNVTCDSVFAGETISCSDGNTTLTQTCPSSSPYTVSFSIPSAGTWTISSGTSLTVFTVPDPVYLHEIPVGSTVTPVNDIQIWLHCADIYDKNYTTLDEVLADASTLQALIASNNAADYMARSTEWAIGINVGLVPTLSSDNAPVIFSTEYSSNYAAYKAFDGVTTDAWLAASGAINNFVGYDFGTPIVVKDVKIMLAARQQARTFEILGSNDGVNWSPALGTITPATTGVLYDVPLNNDTAYRYYIAFCTETLHAAGSWSVQISVLQFYKNGVCDNANAMTYIGANDYCADALLSNATWLEAICNSTYFERVLNIKVPTMTSNTTPSGEVNASGYYGSYLPWRAFRGFVDSDYGWVVAARSAWIQYMFTSAQKIYMVKISNVSKSSYLGQGVKDFTVARSSDGNSFTNVYSGTAIMATTVGQDTDQRFPMGDNGTYKYWRVNCVNNHGASDGIGISDLQFYGRA